jgi:hypothetical protein
MRTCATKAAGAVQLLLTGGPEQRVAEPVGPGLAGITDSHRNVLRFIWSQTHGENFPQGVFFRQTRPADFLWHKIIFCLQKILDPDLIFVYNNSSLENQDLALPESARTSLVRLANQRHPAVTGAGNERLAMKTRSLKIEKTGDYCYGKIIPRIRIAGQWLEQAGFKPGHRVQVLMEQPGNLTLRFLEQPKEVAL